MYVTIHMQYVCMYDHIPVDGEPNAPRHSNIEEFFSEPNVSQP